MNDTQPWEFTCKTCGDHGLTIAHTWSILAGVDSENWQEWGPLEASHHWHYDFKEKIEKTVERGDFGEFAEYKIVKQENDSESLASQKLIKVEAYFQWSVPISFPENIGRNPDIWFPGKRKAGF